METWGFIWIMVILKIPVVALLWLVWYAVKAVPEPLADDQGEGGVGKRDPHGPRPEPNPRRRGPHGDPGLPSPPRTRTPARARERVDR